MNSVKSIIVDAEWLVRAELKTMLAQYPEVKVLGEAANGPRQSRWSRNSNQKKFSWIFKCRGLRVLTCLNRSILIQRLLVTIQLGFFLPRRH
jgi:hypothetical protein